MIFDNYTTEQIRFHHRQLLRDLDYVIPEGVTRSAARLGETTGMMSGEHDIQDRVLKMKLWMRDSMLWALESAARGELVECMRGYVQASHYAGILDGLNTWPHNPTTSDAMHVLRSVCERAMRGQS